MLNLTQFNMKCDGSLPIAGQCLFVTSENIRKPLVFLQFSGGINGEVGLSWLLVPL